MEWYWSREKCKIELLSNRGISNRDIGSTVDYSWLIDAIGHIWVQGGLVYVGFNGFEHGDASFQDGLFSDGLESFRRQKRYVLVTLSPSTSAESCSSPISFMDLPIWGDV